MKLNTIGKNIKFLRKTKQWSQGEVAKRLQISVPAFSKIEAGITTLTYSRLKQIVDIFETTVKDLTDLHKTYDKNFQGEIQNLKEAIYLKEEEIAKLQQTAIALYEELRNK